MEKENEENMPQSGPLAMSTLYQSIQEKFGGLGTSNKSHQLIIPQLKIPQLGAVASSTSDEASRRAATDAQNELLLQEIRRRRAEKEINQNTSIPAKVEFNGFTIPKLRTTGGVPLAEPKLNIPLLNKFQSQQHQVEEQFKKLQITNDEGGDSMLPPLGSPLIDLTTTVIPNNNKDDKPKETASETQMKKLKNIEHFDIPFISCEPVFGPHHQKLQPSGGILDGQRPTDDAKFEQAQPSAVGRLLDEIMGQPRTPQLKYANTPLEKQQLKLYRCPEYGSHAVKRFRFDSASPDELVKQALQKSMRISRT
ncbi:uncharacterized protein Dwil_GK10132 [Drosophila willistoni]|uniref:Uncharacterized protein n=1 Tax=Drosophila willistoni TaxID=7260 RepID=B4ND06_DROWI|nr:uncharacterized protein LOC6649106 [Drosophila willistoni]EDW82715.1 uncharacterized protein Dwil_GK10132 [Drosophila willistoni]